MEARELLTAEFPILANWVWCQF